MARTYLTDEIWQQIEVTLSNHGCRRRRNNRQVMEAIVWKLRTGAPWRDIPKELCPWKTAYNRFNRWAAKGLWKDFFLSYEAKLIRSGYSSTEVTSALINMQVELGMAKSELSEHLGEELPASFRPPMRMEIRSILKSLGVKFTMPRWPTKSSER